MASVDGRSGEEAEVGYAFDRNLYLERWDVDGFSVFWVGFELIKLSENRGQGHLEIGEWVDDGGVW